MAKYEPIKGSSYIQLPKAIADKKAILNIKNTDERCLEWALFSAIYPDKSHHLNQESCYRKHLGKFNFKVIDFPTPIDEIPKVETQNNNAMNVYGCTKSEKEKYVNTFPYYISEQPETINGINLL